MNKKTKNRRLDLKTVYFCFAHQEALNKIAASSGIHSFFKVRC